MLAVESWSITREEGKVLDALACRWPSSYSHGILSVFMFVSQFFLFITPVILDKVSTKRSNSNSITSVKILSPKMALRYWGLRLQHMTIGGTQFNP